MTTHRVVSPQQWLAARKELLAKEKEFTRLRDQLAQQRRDLPWEKVEKHYTFDTPDGPQTLADLFDGRSQLIVYHFMFGPDWPAGCKSCSFWADSYNDNIAHLNARDVTMVVVSRAPLDKLNAYKKRLGWTFNWVSAGEGDFNYDYHVSFTPEDKQKGEVYYNYGTYPYFSSDGTGISVFYKDDDGTVYHTYSAYARGVDMMNAAYQYLDLTPKGRHETTPPQAWLRRRDEYTM